MKNNQNNYAFIDMNNLYLAIKHLGWKINWFKFRKYLKNRFHIQHAFMFIGKIEKHNDLYNVLNNAGFEIIFKKVVERGKETKGNVDIDVAIWTVHYINEYDKAMLITGDGDFYSLADYLHERDKLLKIGIPNRNAYSILLRKFEKVFISDWKRKLEYIPK
jgi:uncharacterized LabA/DUF88 family protein